MAKTDVLEMLPNRCVFGGFPKLRGQMSFLVKTIFDVGIVLVLSNRSTGVD